SLLYWTLVLAVLGGGALASAAPLAGRAAAWAAVVFSAVLSFFLLVLALVANPFDLLVVVPADGLGLNPLLRDGGMLIHPPFLLAGFASFTIPFALALGALIAGES